ncbi:hypothetical protein CFC21_011291 [Triticum aestivum]|uniref:Uncharacterized protein n=4 Tax=Triticinae TaxID=1648030 RepID=A0A452YG72_AEGTS|nr:uncharacterized protein LOC109784917 [Aegilops tauschii subsp. strangulata]XP_044441445.1 uncharacterized protein LOC123167667 [Triticum aestivum]KAF6994632.1 hypothetical protein CFC21_011291 [Triticum aestivum]
MAMAALVVVLSLLFLPTGEAQERRPVEAHPHGLPFESPLALSPAAYDFFHPSEHAQRVAGAPELAPRGQPRGSVVRGAGASAASVARADHEEGGVAPVNAARRGGAVRAGLVAGVFVGAAMVVLAALGLAYAVARRRVGVAQGDAEAASAPKSNA